MIKLVGNENEIEKGLIMYKSIEKGLIMYKSIENGVGGLPVPPLRTDSVKRLLRASLSLLKL